MLKFAEALQNAIIRRHRKNSDGDSDRIQKYARSEMCIGDTEQGTKTNKTMLEAFVRQLLKVHNCQRQL
uniref:UCH domain-containing protein n=1 Tax=Syphacia muris TaxID=451379 RepID=A0A0N5AHX6_9BILA